jgi:hypothetical protein
MRFAAVPGGSNPSRSAGEKKSSVPGHAALDNSFLFAQCVLAWSLVRKATRGVSNEAGRL